VWRERGAGRFEAGIYTPAQEEEVCERVRWRQNGKWRQKERYWQRLPFPYRLFKQCYKIHFWFL